MIRYNPKHWFQFIFRFHRSVQMRLLLPNILFMGSFAGLMTYLFREHLHLEITANVHTLLGIVLGLVLVFRTNTAYDRWWEGRKLWGALINHSRNLALKIDGMLPEEDRESRDYFSRSIGNFAFAFKEHLRRDRKLKELDMEGLDYAPDAAGVPHLPNRIVAGMQRKVNDMLRDGTLHPDQYRVVNRELAGLIDVLGGCERILKTPIPYSYSMYVKKVIFFFILSLPLSLINSMGYYTIPAVMFITYVLAGLELLGEEIEEPFGLDANDLDTEGMCMTIRTNVDAILMYRSNIPTPVSVNA